MTGTARALVAVPLALLLVLVIHEGGHLLAGRLAGFRIGMLGVGPLGVVRAGRGFLIRWLPPSHWGPFALAYPLTLERLRLRVACYIAGGPVASLAFSIAMWAASVGIGDSATSGLVRFTGILSAAVFVATAQPFGTGVGIASDGARWWRLLRNSAEVSDDLVMFTLACEMGQGIRPGHWDEKTTAWLAANHESPVLELTAATGRLRQAMDARDHTIARDQVERIRRVYGKVPRMLRGDAAAEVAFWLAFVDHQVSAQEYVADARGVLVEPFRRWRAEAAVRRFAGEADAAKDALRAAVAALSLGMTAPSALDRELLEELARPSPADVTSS